jgi:peptidoglycan/xylan/chitin deacetylase (PgdA/CDA1 family)
LSSEVTKPLASLSLDLDNKWSYMKTHGDAGWEAFPSYLDVMVPRALEVFRRRGLTLTFFIVGQDAALPRNREALKAIADAGHVIANHSFHHEPWLHLYGEEQIEAEIRTAEEAIEGATGRRPRAFRGPGYSLSQATLRVLVRRGYAYDASTLPTFLGPLARAYYFFTSRFSAAERQQRKALFGNLRDGLRSIRPYHWDVDGTRLLEIPVTTLPLLRVPIHVSYVLYLGVVSPPLARLYFRAAMALCRATGVEPSILLHPLDFLGGEDEADLAFFPAMRMGRERKLGLVADCLDLLQRRFDLQSLDAHAARIAARPELPLRQPTFHVPPPPEPARG